MTNISEILLQGQRAFLLYQLASAPDGTLVQSAANKGIPRQIRDELSLQAKEANDLRWQMVVAGWLTEEKVKRILVYSIAEAGWQQLRTLDGHLPLLPARGTVNPPADERTGLAREVWSSPRVADTKLRGTL